MAHPVPESSVPPIPLDDNASVLNPPFPPITLEQLGELVGANLAVHASRVRTSVTGMTQCIVHQAALDAQTLNTVSNQLMSAEQDIKQKGQQLDAADAALAAVVTERDAIFTQLTAREAQLQALKEKLALHEERFAASAQQDLLISQKEKLLEEAAAEVAAYKDVISTHDAVSAHLTESRARVQILEEEAAAWEQLTADSAAEQERISHQRGKEAEEMAAQLAALQQAVIGHKAVEEKLAQSEANNKALEDKVASQEQALAESASEQKVIHSQKSKEVEKMAADLAALRQSMTDQKELQEKLAKSEASNKALMETVARQEQALAESASQEVVKLVLTLSVPEADNAPQQQAAQQHNAALKEPLIQVASHNASPAVPTTETLPLVPTLPATKVDPEPTLPVSNVPAVGPASPPGPTLPAPPHPAPTPAASRGPATRATPQGRTLPLIRRSARNTARPPTRPVAATSDSRRRPAANNSAPSSPKAMPVLFARGSVSSSAHPKVARGDRIISNIAYDAHPAEPGVLVPSAQHTNALTFGNISLAEVGLEAVSYTVDGVTHTAADNHASSSTTPEAASAPPAPVAAQSADASTSQTDAAGGIHADASDEEQAGQSTVADVPAAAALVFGGIPAAVLAQRPSVPLHTESDAGPKMANNKTETVQEHPTSSSPATPQATTTAVAAPALLFKAFTSQTSAVGHPGADAFVKDVVPEAPWTIAAGRVDQKEDGKTGVTGVETGEEPSTSSPQAEAATGSMPVSPPPPTTGEASGKHLVRDEDWAFNTLSTIKGKREGIKELWETVQNSPRASALAICQDALGDSPQVTGFVKAYLRGCGGDVAQAQAVEAKAPKLTNREKQRLRRGKA